MHLKSISFLPFLLLINYIAIAQIGGTNTMESFNLIAPARIASMGGNNISVNDNDAGFAVLNPALLTSNMNNQFSFNFVDYFAGINYGSAGYIRKYKEFGTFGVNLQFIDYGKFEYTDNTGQVLGDFSANESALTLGWGKPIDTSFSIGANIKSFYSVLEGYSSLGVALDAGGLYYNRKRELSAAVLIKNAGIQLIDYTEGNQERLPFDLQIGVSKKLQHVPFRLSVLAHHLYTFDIRYDDPSVQSTSLQGDQNQKEKKYIADKIFRHFIFGGEILLTKNFHIRLGYNHLRRQELVLQNKFSGVGFSYGFGIIIKKFSFSYGRAVFHAAGPSNHFTLSVNLDEFLFSAKKKIISTETEYHDAL